MSDMPNDQDDFDKAFEGFGEEPVTPPVEPSEPDAATPPAEPEAPKEEPAKNEPETPENPGKEEPETPPTDPAEKPKEGDTPPENPETPPAPEEAKPLTADDVTTIISKMRSDERDSGRELETMTQEVMNAYYPNGLSKTLVDQSTGKQLRTPQDVVDASGGEMSMEEAANWLMNKQYELDTKIDQINNDARKIAETTVSFKRDSLAALQKYEPLFKAYPHLQAKVWDKLMEGVEADTEKGVILKAPDVMGHYDFYLEPYQMAFEHSTQQPATNPTAPATPPATPTVDDRLDITGDGGASEVDDPNDFAQQVSKELAKGL